MKSLPKMDETFFEPESRWEGSLMTMEDRSITLIQGMKDVPRKPIATFE